MGRRSRAVELVLGNVIEHAVSDPAGATVPSAPDKATAASGRDIIVHEARVPRSEHSSAMPTIDDSHPQFDTSRALMHGIAHSFISEPPVAEANAIDQELSFGSERASSVHESSISLGRMPSFNSFRPDADGRITLDHFRQAVTQRHEVRYRSSNLQSRPDDVDDKTSPAPAKPVKSIRFGFKTYAGEVFAALRATLGIATSSYVRSLAGGEAFHDFVSNSQSGAFFFFTTDGKYIIKTMTHNESLWFRDFLPDYFQHLRDNPRSLLVRVVGLYRLKFNGGRHNLHFYVMQNVFDKDASIPIHARYDLKGSTLGRAAKSGETVLKDLDFEQQHVVLRLGGNRSAFLAQLQVDANFLSHVSQMDYSLLLGVYHRDLDETNPSDEELLARLHYTAEEAASPPEFDFRGIISRDAAGRITEVYFVGIIDYLQKYNWKKKTGIAFLQRVTLRPK
ncbi:hypothetical protein PBRA_008977 [Plasmodiophora brassicae]|uniref:PIPK domain-containing protein n=1 Tax=Plasmodiophora brassicae TaxID=37360 RepID=A0A0G4J428_PLABS|nr:hypothetical protein PBRA_008977 [Plasmodiophora brassicae]